MPHLFDSDVIIFYINGVPRARQLFTRYAQGGIFISTITYMEVLDGIPASPDPVVAGERLDRLIAHIPLIGFESTDAVRCAGVRQQLRRDGRQWRRRGIDLMIAATAMEHDLTLLTNNPGDYDDIDGLDLEHARIGG